MASSYSFDHLLRYTACIIIVWDIWKTDCKHLVLNLKGKPICLTDRMTQPSWFRMAAFVTATSSYLLEYSLNNFYYCVVFRLRTDGTRRCKSRIWRNRSCINNSNHIHHCCIDFCRVHEPDDLSWPLSGRSVSIYFFKKIIWTYL